MSLSSEYDQFLSPPQWYYQYVRFSVLSLVVLFLLHFLPWNTQVDPLVCRIAALLKKYLVLPLKGISQRKYEVLTQTFTFLVGILPAPTLLHSKSICRFKQQFLIQKIWATNPQKENWVDVTQTYDLVSRTGGAAQTEKCPQWENCLSSFLFQKKTDSALLESTKSRLLQEIGRCKKLYGFPWLVIPKHKETVVLFGCKPFQIRKNYCALLGLGRVLLSSLSLSSLWSLLFSSSLFGFKRFQIGK